MRPIFWKEIRTLLMSRIGWILYGVFVIFSSLFLFWFNNNYNLFDAGLASLYLYFSLTSYLLVIFIPGATMRMLADEKKSGNMEVLKTLPLKNSQIVMGKYWAAFVYSLGFIFLIFPIAYFCIYNLSQPVGNIDHAVVFTSMMGILLEVALLCALGLFFTSNTENSTAAYFLSVLSGFLLTVGFSGLAQFNIFGSFDYILENLSVEYQLEYFFKGVIPMGGLFYILFLLLIFLFLTFKNVEKS